MPPALAPAATVFTVLDTMHTSVSQASPFAFVIVFGETAVLHGLLLAQTSCAGVIVEVPRADEQHHPAVGFDATSWVLTHPLRVSVRGLSPSFVRPSSPTPRHATQLNHHSQGMINLISYEDAATAVVAALNGGIAEAKGEEGAPGVKGQIFLAAGDEPITRQKICEVALTHPLYGRKKMPKFKGDDTPPQFAVTGPSKVYDSSWTRRTLGWEPSSASMEEYFERDRLAEGELKVLE